MAELEIEDVDLSQVISVFRHILAAAPDANVEEILSSIMLSRSETWNLFLDVSLTGDDVEDRIIDAFVSSQQVISLVIVNKSAALSLPYLLSRSLPTMASLLHLHLLAFQMSLSEAEGVFGSFHESSSLEAVSVDFNGCDAVATAFARFLCRESSSLVMATLESFHHGLSKAAFHLVCEALAESPWLEILAFDDFQVDDENLVGVTESLANMIVNSSSLIRIRFDRDVPGTLSIDNVCLPLSKTDAVKDFDLFFQKAQGNDLELRRTSPWKPLLSADNVPLGLWPRILAKTTTWNTEDSHSSFDALFFLVREKNDVLLQNVRRRRIRKRKRFQISTY